ncbi:MAG: hypothetical protein Q9178_005709 [Gyalolechia marmorata]
MASDHFPQWNPANSASTQPSYPAPSATFVQPQFTGTPQQQLTSNKLARRPLGQDVADRTPYSNDSNTELWPSFAADNGIQQPGETDRANNVDELDQKALVAEMDAQTKRKQIPPFVQKLGSFLDESRNTDLIRWSESGDSFVVIDEEEFARTLIPELFKHKNYASFVRQLNMYGFHKKVGLSDNSMRASERKNKSPSEYYNPYFKRGRPNLLWLIHKPTPPSKGGRGPRAKQDDGSLEEDVEEIYDMDRPNNADHNGMDASGIRQGRQPLMISHGGDTPQNLAAVQEELQAVRKQQQMIAALLQKTRAEHEQLYGQAANFQKLHDRHESSINAILTFLATVYNRSLEGKNGQNFEGMFGSIAQDPQAQGKVVDDGIFGGQGMVNGQNPGGFRRQPLLLQAPPNNYQSGSVTSPGVTVESPASQTQNRPFTIGNQRGAYSPGSREVFGTPSNRSSQSPQTKADGGNGQPSEADILSMIQSTNASQPYSNGSRMDFPEALSHLQTADGQLPLTPNQRSDALRLIASTAGNPSANSNGNALTSPSPPMPTMAQYQQSKERLDQLSNALKEQGTKVEQLSNVLAPLSPSGSIPGMTDGGPNYGGGDPGGTDMLDLDQIFNSGDYFTNPDGGDADFHFNPNDPVVPDFAAFGGPNGEPPPEEAVSFGFDGALDDGAEGSVVETVGSSEGGATSSPAANATVEESNSSNNNVVGEDDSKRRLGKRRRKG